MSPAATRICSYASALTLPALRIARGRRRQLTRVLVVGDSQAQGLAGGLQRQLRGDASWRVIDRSRIATGLCSPSALQLARGGARRRRGGTRRDRRRDVRRQRPPAGAPARPHRRQAGGVVRRLVWRACARDRRGPEAVLRGRHLGGTSDRARPGLCRGHGAAEPALRRAVDGGGRGLVPLLAAVHSIADGNYAPYGKGIDGQTTRLRADDGVHFTGAGYDVLARALLPVIALYRPAGAHV